jgi:SAM-dependent methyltransferase
MSAMEFYDALAPVYHLNYADWTASVQRQGEALDALLRSRGVPGGGTILDAACGIGTQSLGLAVLGYRVSGSDLSTRAVERARAEALKRQLPIEFSVADLRNVARHHGRTFDAVIACDNAIPHLLRDEDILAALEQLYQCTSPGGACLISVRDYAAEARSSLPVPRQPIIHTDGDLRRILFQVWAFEGDQYRLDLYIIEDHPEREPVVQVMRTRYYAVGTDTLKELMLRAGFVNVSRSDEPFFQPVILGSRPEA